jgi:hypothetical protein
MSFRWTLSFFLLQKLHCFCIRRRYGNMFSSEILRV